MQTHLLICHPDTPAILVKSVWVETFMTDGNDVLVEFHVEQAENLKLPAWASPARRDGLWKTTCFEMFLKGEIKDAYWEFNFSPSCEWAAYSFEGYRAGMKEMEVAVPPHIESVRSGAHYQLDADIDLLGIPCGPVRAGFCAVIEEADGTKSYWALSHPPDKPDFHDPACFAAMLAAPEIP